MILQSIMEKLIKFPYLMSEGLSNSRSDEVADKRIGRERTEAVDWGEMMDEYAP